MFHPIVYGYVRVVPGEDTIPSVPFVPADEQERLVLEAYLGRYAKTHAWGGVLQETTDTGRVDFLRRPAVKGLVAAAGRGEAAGTVILTARLDRLFWSAVDLANSVRWLSQCGVTVHPLDIGAPFDHGDPFVSTLLRAFDFVIGWFSTYKHFAYRCERERKIRAGLATKARPPYGFKRYFKNGKKKPGKIPKNGKHPWREKYPVLVPDPNIRAVGAMAIEEYERLGSWEAVAEQFVAGHVWRNGPKWTAKTTESIAKREWVLRGLYQEFQHLPEPERSNAVLVRLRLGE